MSRASRAVTSRAQQQAGHDAAAEATAPGHADAAWLGVGFGAFGSVLGAIAGASSVQGISQMLLTSVLTFVGGAFLSYAGFRVLCRQSRGLRSSPRCTWCTTAACCTFAAAMAMTRTARPRALRRRSRAASPTRWSCGASSIWSRSWSLRVSCRRATAAHSCGPRRPKSRRVHDCPCKVSPRSTHAWTATAWLLQGKCRRVCASYLDCAEAGAGSCQLPIPSRVPWRVCVTDP